MTRKTKWRSPTEDGDDITIWTSRIIILSGILLTLGALVVALKLWS